MLRRSLFVSAFMLAGVVGFASNAKAADYPINTTFTAKVNATCSLTNPTTGTLNGTLVPNAGKDTLSTAGGTSAKIGVDCTGGTLKVSVPALTTKPTAFAGTPTNTAKVTTLTQMVNNTDTAGITLVAGDKGDAMVDMTSSLPAGTPFDAGDYTYTVIVTATL